MKEDENKTTTTIDEDDEGINYSPKSEFSKASLVEECIKNTFISRAKEMKKGYFNFKEDKRTGELSKIWIPDSRKVFISSVDGLLGILAPEIHRDKTMKDVMKEFEEEKQKIFDRYAYKECIMKRVNGKETLRLTGSVFIPESDCFIPQYIKVEGKGTFVKSSRGLWNEKIEHFWDENLRIYNILFGELNKLCDRNKYFKSRTTTG